jgi:hypothetical protein
MGVSKSLFWEIKPIEKLSLIKLLQTKTYKIYLTKKLSGKQNIK